MRDDRKFAPATSRNREPILACLREVLPASGLILEIASGTGEHAVHFARAMPRLDWQPSDPSAEARCSIAAWAAPASLGNLREPLALDAAEAEWPVTQADALVCINMIHISPWEATQGLMAGAGRILGTGCPLYLYGPYRRTAVPLEPSNAAFDADLRRRDTRWGLRHVQEVADCGVSHGLTLERVVEMPANNLSLVLRRR